MNNPSRPPGAHRHNPTEPPGEEQTDLAHAQQQVIVDVLAHCAGQPEERIEESLWRTLRARDIPVPPRPWLRAVAGEIANDRLYVVGNGTVTNEYFSSDSGGRASDRVADPDQDLEPSAASEKRMAEGHAPGGQVV